LHEADAPAVDPVDVDDAGRAPVTDDQFEKDADLLMRAAR
jgi:hypothetical protein